MGKFSEKKTFVPVPAGTICCKCGCSNASYATGECEKCKEANKHEEANNVLKSDAVKSAGEPIDPQTRGYMESRFGQDFSKVKVHTDEPAADSTKAVSASAYTVGNDIFFGAGQYQPEKTSGKLLLAHELTHVVQQRGSGSTNTVARKEAAAPAQLETGSQNNSGTTERLLAIITDVERVQAKAAASDETHSADAKKIAEFVEQLRAVANGNDEKLKLDVISAFSKKGVEQAEKQMSGEDAVVTERTPVQMAAKSMRLSQPQDAAEIEAERVSRNVVYGGQATVTSNIERDSINRQAEGLVAAGVGILAMEAESLPATSWNPPGWVVLGVATVVAAALIGVGVYMASNVADTGIMGEVQGLIEAAKAAGRALTICEALAQLMELAKRAGDTTRANKIKATQKAKGCRHSSYS